jgi:hypothetical protein
MPTLAVSIPTYQRSELLRRNLQPLVRNALQHGVTVWKRSAFVRASLRQKNCLGKVCKTLGDPEWERA